MVVMKRRSFLQMLGFGVAAAALPTPSVDPRFAVPPEKFASRLEHTATDGLGGTYEYKYTFVTKAGETPSDIPVGPTGTTSRKIYRSGDRRGPYKLIGTIPGDQATFTDGIRP